MDNVTLIIIYNHKFDRNIEKLEKIYENRFKRIFHLVPFYTGDKPNVIPVYESSFYFQGYVAQGFEQYFGENEDYYFFIGDDVYLNPEINETNIGSYFGVSSTTSFVPNIFTLHDMEIYWERVHEAVNFTFAGKGVEIKNELPDAEAAYDLIRRHGYTPAPIPYSRLYNEKSFSFKSKLLHLGRKKVNAKKVYEMAYPLVGGYSDIFIVNKNAIKKFKHYAGIFASGKLFVEIAIPTALLLSSANVATEKSLSKWGLTFWSEAELAYLNQFGKSIETITKKFPKDRLYIHPVKISTWTI